MVSNQLTQKTFGMNYCLLKQGDTPNKVYLIEEGVVEVVWSKNWTVKNDQDFGTRWRTHDLDRDLKFDRTELRE